MMAVAAQHWRPAVGFVLLAGLFSWQWHLLARPLGMPAVPADDVRTIGEIAGASTVSQTMTVGSDGFDGVALSLRRAADESQGQVVFELHAVVREADDRLLYREIREAREVVAAGTYHWRFPPISDSAGRSFRITIAMPAAPPGHGLTALKTRSERFRDGVLSFDGKEVWGDLVFATSARGATPLARVRSWHPGLPDWAVTPRVVLLALAVWDVVAALAIWAVLTAVAPARADRASSPGHVSATGRSRTVLLWGAACVVAVATPVAWAWWHDTGLEPDAISLLDRFPESEKRTSMRHLQDAFHEESVHVDRTWRCLLALPSSRITWEFDVPSESELRLLYGLRPDVWQGPGDGAVFRVGVVRGGEYRELARTWLSPAVRPEDRRLVPLNVRLTEHGETGVRVVLNTEPGPSGNAVGDAAAWCAVRVVPIRQ